MKYKASPKIVCNMPTITCDGKIVEVIKVRLLLVISVVLFLLPPKLVPGRKETCFFSPSLGFSNVSNENIRDQGCTFHWNMSEKEISLREAEKYRL
jgi:hypothetical protein